MLKSLVMRFKIIALRNEKGSYNRFLLAAVDVQIIALRNEKGSYNELPQSKVRSRIIALRNEKGSYNSIDFSAPATIDYSTAK